LTDSGCVYAANGWPSSEYSTVSTPEPVSLAETVTVAAPT
jgi:hypothetical protein